MDEEAGADTISAGTEIAASPRAAGEVDLARILRDDHAQPLCGHGRARDVAPKNGRGIDGVVAEQAVERHLARATAADGLEHQRMCLDDPIDEPIATPIQPDVSHGSPPRNAPDAGPPAWTTNRHATP